MEMSRICSGCRDGAAFERPFAMAFQPIVDTHDNQVFAYEALVRGCAGEGAQTILSQVNDQNRYAFDQACRVKAIQTAVSAGILDTGALLSINFLPDAVYSPAACIRLTLRTAGEVGLPVERLIFEFTENQRMRSPQHVSSIIETYKEIGFKVAIDDFGAGYSGLDMFAQFVPDEIKIDMDLVRGVDHDSRRQAIVKAIVAMCSALDTIVIAEGIETPEEAEMLTRLGVRYHQGFWYSRPALAALPKVRETTLWV